MLRSCSSRSWCPWTLLQGWWWSDFSFGLNFWIPETFEWFWRAKPALPPHIAHIMCMMDEDNCQSKLRSAGNAWPFPIIVAANTFVMNIPSPVSENICIHIFFWAGIIHISSLHSEWDNTPFQYPPLKSRHIYASSSYMHSIWMHHPPISLGTYMHIHQTFVYWSRAVSFVYWPLVTLSKEEYLPAVHLGVNQLKINQSIWLIFYLSS